MSYILDALRRAERERHRENGGAASEVANATPSAPPAKSRLRTAVIIAGVVIIALLAANIVLMLLWDTSNTPTQTAAHSAPSRAPQPTNTTNRQIAHAKAPAPQLAAQPTEAAQPVADEPSSSTAKPAPTTQPVATLIPAGAGNPIADANAIHSLDQLTPPKSAPVRHAKPLKASGINSNSAQTGTVASNAKAQPANTSKAVAAENEPSTKSNSQSGGISTTPLSASGSVSLASAKPPATTQPPPAPTPSSQDLSVMPDNYRAHFPRIKVQVHVYDPDPARSWVLIDGKRYQAGDTLPQGPKIEKIVPEGIVFDWKDRHVLLPN